MIVQYLLFERDVVDRGLAQGRMLGLDRPFDCIGKIRCSYVGIGDGPWKLQNWNARPRLLAREEESGVVEVNRSAARLPLDLVGGLVGRLLVNACAGAGDSSTVCGSIGRRVGPSNYKIGLGVGSEVEGADAAMFEIGTPDPGFLTPGLYLRLVGQVGQPELVGQPIEVPVKKGFCDWLARLAKRRAARISSRRCRVDCGW